MNRHVLKRLSIFVLTALITSLFAVSTNALAQTTTDSTTQATDDSGRTTDDSTTDDSDNSGSSSSDSDDSDNSGSSNDSDDSDNSGSSSDDSSTDDSDSSDDDCAEIRLRIREYEGLLNGASDEGSLSDEEALRTRAKISDLKAKLQECLNDSDTSDDDSTEIRRTCAEITADIQELEEKIRAAAAGTSDSTSDTDLAEMKRKLEELKLKQDRCRNSISDESDDDSTRPALADLPEECRECAALRLKLHDASNEVERIWERITDIRAEIAHLKEKLAENEVDGGNSGPSDIETRITSLEQEATDLLEKLQQAKDAKDAAKKAVMDCQQVVEESCPDLTPRVRDGIRKDDDEVIRNREAMLLFVRWGYLDGSPEEPESTEWEVSAKVDDGTLRVIKKVLFENNDDVIDTLDEKSVQFNSNIFGHNDGVLLMLKPGENATEFTLTAGDFSKVYKTTDLYKITDRNELTDGTAIEIRNPIRGLHLGSDVYQKLRERKEKTLERLFKLDEKIREHSDNDKLDEVARKLYDRFHNEVEDYIIPEDGDLDIDALLASCEETLTDSADEDKIQECEDQLNDLRERHRAAKVAQGLIPFTDVDDNEWYFDFVRFAKEKGIVSGNSDGTFEPGREATRAELLKMAMESAGEALDEEGDDNPEDSRDHWARKYVAKALKKGFVSGFDDGFHPDQSITRAEALKIVFKALGIDTPECSESAFPDTEGHWAMCIIKHAYDLGIVDGNPDGNFAPDQPISRAAIAKILRTTIDYIKEQNKILDSEDEDISDAMIDEAKDEINEVVEDAKESANESVDSDSSDNSEETTEDSTTDDTTDDTTTDNNEPIL